jgi:hypothetical protein
VWREVASGVSDCARGSLAGFTVFLYFLWFAGSLHALLVLGIIRSNFRQRVPTISGESLFPARPNDEQKWHSTKILTGHAPDRQGLHFTPEPQVRSKLDEPHQERRKASPGCQHVRAVTAHYPHSQHRPKFSTSLLCVAPIALFTGGSASAGSRALCTQCESAVGDVNIIIKGTDCFSMKTVLIITGFGFQLFKPHSAGEGGRTGE